MAKDVTCDIYAKYTSGLYKIKLDLLKVIMYQSKNTIIFVWKLIMESRCLVAKQATFAVF